MEFKEKEMSVQLIKKEAKYYTGGGEETTKLYYDGFEVLRTTSTGVKINWKAPLWRIVWGYLQYVYYSIKCWLDTPLRYALFIMVFTGIALTTLWLLTSA
jgi:hypothetical protein